MKSKLTARELSNFCGQMGILLHSGISTTEGLHILCEESKTDTDREILKPLINSMEKNGSLSQALEDSGCFPKAMTAYIKTGEETGCLDEIMTSLSRHYDQEQEISQQIRSAVTYPLIMLGMMAVVILVLLVKVLPVFQQVFHQMGLEMNGISQGLLNAGNMISRYSAVFLILAVLLIGCILFFSLTEKGHAKLRKLVTHLPVFCEIPVAMDYSRLAQGLSLGLRSGLSPETSLELTEAMLTQPEILEKLRKTSELLNNGEAFSKALTESELFSGMEGRLISISFYSGTSDETFRRLSQQYTEKSIDLISQAVSVVEPTIVILLSLLVGLVLLSVMMPLLGILSDFAIYGGDNMELFESRRKKIFRGLLLLFPVFLLIFACILFVAGVSHTSGQALVKEQDALEQALKNSAVRSYAMTGEYPEDLAQLLNDYHITYDKNRFIVEYIPNGSNLLPSISVIARPGSSKGGASS